MENNTELSTAQRADKWMAEGDKGVSSKTMWHFFMAKDYARPARPLSENGYPGDSSDFGRCLALLTYVPEWEERISELSELQGLDGATWYALGQHWEELKSLYHTNKQACTALLKQFLAPIEKASGEIAPLGPNAHIRVRKGSGPIAEAILAKANGASDEEVVEKVKAARAGMGHNSGEAEGVDKATQARLKSIIDRVERLEEEKSGLAEDIKEIFGEAKATGFDVKVIRQIIRLRKIDLDKRREAEMLLETYKCAIGME